MTEKINNKSVSSLTELYTGVFNIINKPIYIIGDIHGDYQCLIHSLVDLSETCNITKLYTDEFNTENREYIEWNKNNNSVLVLCGDMIHRKRFDHILDDECSDIYILKTLLRLKKEAQKNNGDILIISGNHEIMNILNIDDDVYTSPLNYDCNKLYFSNEKFIKEYINNSYAWIKINDILIAHGGLCSDYLDYININNKNIKEIKEIKEIVGFVNDKYRNFFISENYKINSTNNNDKVGYDLFVKYDIEHKKKHNMFWCREWGYSGINCKEFKNILLKINCKKMIISHCPQFLSPDVPKMINFECIDNDVFNIARIDLGMSRCFEYNKEDKFFYYLSNNYNRKMSLLKLLYDNNNNIYFDNKSIITKKLSCLQYLLLKYGLTINKWKSFNIKSNWIGFNHLQELLDSIDKYKDDNYKNLCNSDNKNNIDTLLCLIAQIYSYKINLHSIVQFKNLYKNLYKNLDK